MTRDADEYGKARVPDDDDDDDGFTYEEPVLPSAGTSTRQRRYLDSVSAGRVPCRSAHGKANLSEAHLGKAQLWAARLEGANLQEAHLEEAFFGGPLWRRWTSRKLTWKALNT